MRRLSLRGKLLLASWLFAFAVALVLTLVLHANDRRHLLGQFDKTLETKCDEVVTVLSHSGRLLPIGHFFRIETSYRRANPAYFYQVTDLEGHLLARSENLGDTRLPLPDWSSLDAASAVHTVTTPHPASTDTSIRIRSERVRLPPTEATSGNLVIQTAGTMEAFELASRETLREALVAGAFALGLVFVPLWFVATRCLRPVTDMTAKVSRITAANLPDRLSQTGTDDEMDRLAAVLNEMLERVASSLRQVEQFSSDAAHQLRTPLTRIRVTLDYILRSDAFTPWRADLEAIRDETDRLSRLCRGLLLLARLDMQRPEPGDDDPFSLKERVDLGAVVSELVEQMTPLALESGIELAVTPESPLESPTPEMTVPGNRALITEALFNLLENAILATPRERTVSVSLSSNPDEATVFVRDEGAGVPAKERDRIFDRFYRLSPDSEQRTGLGLAIVKGIAEAHGGRVEVLDAPTRGAEFRLVLPRKPA